MVGRGGLRSWQVQPGLGAPRPLPDLLAETSLAEEPGFSKHLGHARRAMPLNSVLICRMWVKSLQPRLLSAFLPPPLSSFSTSLPTFLSGENGRSKVGERADDKGEPECWSPEDARAPPLLAHL